MTFKGTPLGPVDVSSVAQRKLMARNIAEVYNRGDAAAREEGRHWYAKANEAIERDARGMSIGHNAAHGVVAAVSPNMDWDAGNVDALKVAKSLRGRDWASISKGDLSPVHGTALRTATHASLVKAHRILQGEDPDTVLDRKTNPKTNSFYHNLMGEDQHVTIDGRAHDIAANRLQGWQDDRKLPQKAVPGQRGGPTRYSHFEDAYRNASTRLNAEHNTNLRPMDLQAAVWTQGKVAELSTPTKAGTPRKKGPTRQGQPYYGPGGLLP